MRKTTLAILCLALSSTLLAQQAMNNDAVIKLVKAGLGEELIVSTINAQAGTYNTSADAIIALKQAGATDKEISAILQKAAGGSAPALAAPAAAPADPDDPNAQHEAGIWVYSDKAPTGAKMVLLEPSVYTQGKMGGVFATAMTYGIAKAKIKAVLNGAHANAKFTDPGVVFYFYFEESAPGLSQASSPFSGTTTPNEYSLVKFDVKDKTRETVVGKFSAWGGTGGVDDKASVTFTHTKLRPGVYKVAPNAPLPKGEYGFLSGGAGAASPMGASVSPANKVFDFSVQ